MPEEINLSVNGQCQVPPGFRFHPTEEELLNHYLRKKVAYQKIDLDVIREVDLNKLEPWDIQERCKIGSTPQNDYYFFSHKDKKYPTGTRTNRATAAGFWKATGRDKIIFSSCKRIGLRKTLVFYKGRAPHGLKSDWIMHEYRLDDNHDTKASNSEGDYIPEDGWVVCRVFKKKNYLKALESPNATSSSTNYPKSPICGSSGNDGMLDQILFYMGRSCKMEKNAFGNINDTSNYNDIMNIGATNSSTVANFEGMQEKFMHLPGLESPSLPSLPLNNSHFDQNNHNYKACDQVFNEKEPYSSSSTKANWVALDRLVASQLNGQVDTTEQLSCFRDQINTSFGSCANSIDIDNDAQLSQLHQGRPDQSLQDFKGGNDLWIFADSSSPSPSDPLSHLSV